MEMFMNHLRMFVIPIVLFFATPAFAGPFGLSMGMTKEQIGGEIKEMGPGYYAITSVPEPNPNFKMYSLIIGKELGLAKIVAVTPAIKTNIFGDALKTKFEELEELLIKKYGGNKKFNSLAVGSIWNKPQEWMTSLKKKERNLSAAWDKNTGAKLPDDLAQITLTAAAVKSDLGIIVLMYYFSNFNQVLKEIKGGKADSP